MPLLPQAVALPADVQDMAVIDDGQLGVGDRVPQRGVDRGETRSRLTASRVAKPTSSRLVTVPTWPARPIAEG